MESCRETENKGSGLSFLKVHLLLLMLGWKGGRMRLSSLTRALPMMRWVLALEHGIDRRERHTFRT